MILNDQVDDTESFGEVPGTDAYKKRIQDAVPDELEIIPEGQGSRRGSDLHEREQTGADAVPDSVMPASSPKSGSASESQSASSAKMRVPRMVVTRIDSKPAHGEIPGTEAYEIRKEDAVPDVLEKKADVPG